ncbi:uncharacterized protein [Mytilus edulis]|uniref:uncharacterized protein n=1 Tax=Mytilus edulis TaxID=6550 RepID=UPI0039F03234
MQKILLILVPVLLLAVVEQTTGQKCSTEYCRKWPRSDCGCKGCCWGKLNCLYGRCERRWDFQSGQSLYSCFCYNCGGIVAHDMGPSEPPVPEPIIVDPGSTGVIGASAPPSPPE